MEPNGRITGRGPRLEEYIAVPPEVLEQQEQPARGRVTIIAQVYCQQTDEDPIVGECRFMRWLETLEQAVSRTIQIGEQWAPLDMLWLKTCSMVMLTNEEGRRFVRVPTKRQLEAAEAKVVKIGKQTEHGVELIGQIRARHIALFEPEDVHALRLRCVSGVAKVTMRLVPE